MEIFNDGVVMNLSFPLTSASAIDDTVCIATVHNQNWSLEESTRLISFFKKIHTFGLRADYARKHMR